MHSDREPDRAETVICFDIGGSWIRAAQAETVTDMRALGRVPTPLHDFDAFVAAFAGLIDAADAPQSAPVAVAIAGIVDPRNGALKCANIPCVDGRALASDLSDALAREVRVANDADCFALAEAHAGAGRSHLTVFGAILGTGVGGGLVANGRLVTGAGGYAGEWGHGPIVATRIPGTDTEVPRFPCGCGQSGCVDTIGGARGIERLHAFLCGEKNDSQTILTRWQDGDPVATQTVDAYLALVSDPLALTVNITGADIVPVGGGLSNFEPLISALDVAVREKIMRKTDAPLVVPGECRQDGGLLGAAALALDPAYQ